MQRGEKERRAKREESREGRAQREAGRESLARATAANSAALTVVSAAVDGADVPEEFTSLAVGVDRPADPGSFGPPLLEAERQDKSFSTAVTVLRKACPRCSDTLLWTAHSDGRYMSGWACDNHEV